MERTKILTALKGVRGRKPVDLAALEQLIVRFSYLITEQSWIKEIDINPLLASPEGLLALDARVVLHPADLSAFRRVRRSGLTRRNTFSPGNFPDGLEVVIRPIRPEDEPAIARFHEQLSERSVYLRYFHLIDLDRRVSHDRLLRICFNDYDRDIALVAEHRERDSRGRPPAQDRRQRCGAGGADHRRISGPRPGHGAVAAAGRNRARRESWSE